MKRLYLLLLLLLGICSIPVRSESGAPPPGRVKITFLQLNDVYEYTTVDDGRKGSFPRIETLRKNVRSKNQNTIFVLAGDTLSPSVASSLFRGKQMVAMWNAVGLDFAVLGNHEFDFGSDVLRERIKESKFVWLACNVRDKRTGKIFADMPEFVIRDVGGVKVGFFGLLTPDTGENSNAGAEVQFDEPIAAARPVVEKMRQQGAQVVVALTHMTLEDDKRLAREIPIDLIMGGHEHVPLQSMVGKTPIFKWGCDARILGKIDMSVELPSGQLVEMDWTGISVGKSVPSDPRISALVASYEKQLSGQLEVPVAHTEVVLDGRSSSCRRFETNLGNFVADALRAHFQSDVALLTGSAIRIDRVVPVGPISRRVAMMILPYENALVKLSLTGKQLRGVVEHSLNLINTKASAFPQVSGMRIQYDPKSPPGSRVKYMEVGGKPLKDDRVYTMTCSQFLRKGGCGFKMQNFTCLAGPEDSASESAVLIEALIKAKNVSPKIEGRIQIAP